VTPGLVLIVGAIELVLTLGLEVTETDGLTEILDGVDVTAGFAGIDFATSSNGASTVTGAGAGVDDIAEVG
jgi:hypothetical protein